MRHVGAKLDSNWISIWNLIESSLCFTYYYIYRLVLVVLKSHITIFSTTKLKSMLQSKKLYFITLSHSLSPLHIGMTILLDPAWPAPPRFTSRGFSPPYKSRGAGIGWDFNPHTTRSGENVFRLFRRILPHSCLVPHW